MIAETMENKNVMKEKDNGEPTEEELCHSLTLLKKKLPNRSMEHIIKSLYKAI